MLVCLASRRPLGLGANECTPHQFEDTSSVVIVRLAHEKPAGFHGGSTSWRPKEHGGQKQFSNELQNVQTNAEPLFAARNGQIRFWFGSKPENVSVDVLKLHFIRPAFISWFLMNFDAFCAKALEQ
jgi:hypothetical protein